MQDLKIAFIQSELHWHNPQANRSMFEEKIWEIDRPVDLIILPEMFTTGFTMEASSQAEVMGMTTTKWMEQIAAQTKAVLTGSVIIKEQGSYYNRLIWMYPDGHYQYYDKRHLFRYAGEHKDYTSGKDRLIVELKGWKICPQICYDLRFPVWSRNSYIDDKAAFDVLIYVANWPDKRVSAWDALLKARAIENIAYTIGVNRVGEDENGVSYCGHSAAYNYNGEVLHAPKDHEQIVVLKLKYDSLVEFRKRFPFYLDADKFEIR